MKTIIFLITLLLSINTFACWYSKSNYTDYIYSVNDVPIIGIQKDDNGIASYNITNNIIVDLPLTISMKLISNQQVIINSNKQQEVPEIIRGMLQYRVIPNNNWVTVENYNTPTGTIPTDSKPTTYFGTNNIWPKNCKKGDVIMIRLYLTDGQWQSGETDNLCTNIMETVETIYGTRTSLPNNFKYKMDGREIIENDLGGAWYPHLAITVIYSGNERPLR